MPRRRIIWPLLSAIALGVAGVLLLPQGYESGSLLLVMQIRLIEIVAPFGQQDDR